MRDTALRQRHPAGPVSDDNSVLRSSDLFIVERDTLHQPNSVDALLKTHASQVVEGQPGKSDDGRAIESRFVKAIHQMDRPRTCRPNANAEAAAVLGEARCHKGGRLLVAYADVFNPILALAQGFDDRIYTVTNNARVGRRAPTD